MHSLLYLALAASTVSALSFSFPFRSSEQRPIGHFESEERYLVELEPGVTQWVTENEKWELRRVSFEPALERLH